MERRTLRLMPVKQTEGRDGAQRQTNHARELLLLVGALRPVISNCWPSFGMLHIRVEDNLEKNPALKIFSIMWHKKILQTWSCVPSSWSCVAVCTHDIITGPLDQRHLFPLSSNHEHTLKWANTTNECPWCESLPEPFSGPPTESRQRSSDLP